MDGEDRRLFERSLQQITARYSGDDLDEALDQLGWNDALATDPRSAISILFQCQGAANATSSALGHVLAHALGAPSGPGTGMVLPPIGRWDPPGTIDGRDLVVRGLGHSSLSRLQSVVVVLSTGERSAGVDMPASSLVLRPVDGIDPDLSLLEVSGRWVSAGRASEVLAGDWSTALALGRLAVAHELVGASRTMLDLACEHARSRIQFGRPIGSFQAIRHRLAETLVGIEMAEAMLDSAWMDREPGTAAMAKAVAGRQARTAARHCQQVLAGMGFTTEHPLHHYIRRTLVLDGLLGSAPNLTTALGTEVVTAARLPAVPRL
jgi:hypothetical protein